MTKGKMIHVRGNVLEPQFLNDNELAVIPHCCNTLGVMGAGVALGLRKKWEKVWTSYKELEDMSSNGLKNRLGEVCFAKVEDNIVVANMIGQDGTVSESNPKPVKYWALLYCMKEILATLGRTADRRDKIPVFHCPKFGSDLAGGNWELIEELIRETWVDRGFDVVIYEFEADKEKWGIIENE